MKPGRIIIFLAILLSLFSLGQWAKSSNLEYARPISAQVSNHAGVVGLPVHLSIPAIEVEAKIQSVGLGKSGEMAVPDNFTDVGWYALGPRPGSKGTAVIDGHLDGRNLAKAVFYDLGNLKLGDVVEVLDDEEHEFQFKVVAVKFYKYNDPADEVFSSSDSKVRLNLITCTGDWIKAKKLYDRRTVVFTELIQPSLFP